MEGPKKYPFNLKKSLISFRKVGILGGSFDPPTLGHLQMAAEAINLRHVDEVWMVPCGDRTQPNIEAPTPAEDRYNMTELLIKEFFPKDFPVKVSDIELKNGEAIPTYNLMQKLSGDSASADCDFYFIIGSDLLEKMRTWEFGYNLAEEIKFIIFIRQGYEVKEEVLPKNCIVVTTTFVASSSTKIRNRIIGMRNPRNSDLDHPPVLQRRVSSDRNQSFSHMYELDMDIPLRTIPEETEVGERVLSDLEKLYLGVYGVVPRSVIEYMIEKKLYLTSQENPEEAEEPSTPQARSEDTHITVGRDFEISVGYGE